MRKASQGVKERMRYWNMHMGRIWNCGAQPWLQLEFSEDIFKILTPDSCSQRSWLNWSGEEPGQQNYWKLPRIFKCAARVEKQSSQMGSGGSRQQAACRSSGVRDAFSPERECSWFKMFTYWFHRWLWSTCCVQAPLQWLESKSQAEFDPCPQDSCSLMGSHLQE